MRKFYELLFRLLSLLVTSLPLSVQLGIGKFIGILWFDVFRIRRSVAISNLKLAYPDWTDEKIKQVARASCLNIGMTFMEFLRLFDSRKDYSQLFHYEGLEHLDQALIQNKGVCLLTLHLGNLDWATYGLNLRAYRFSIISKEFKLQWLNDLWFKVRSQMGNEFIPPRRSSISILRHLKGNKIVCFVLDQFMGPPIGVKTRFFGIETGTAMGLAVIAGRSGAPVVPAYSYRKSDGTTVIHFDPEIKFTKLETQDSTIQHMTQVYCDKLEEFVRVCPEQWMWVHRRWKEFKH